MARYVLGYDYLNPLVPGRNAEAVTLYSTMDMGMPGDWDVTVKVTLSGATAPAASPVFSTIF